MKTKLFTLFKRETVLCIAGLFAILSAFVVPPSKAYLDYIDFRVLALLFCLMLVVAGFQAIGLFENIIEKMLKHINQTRKLVFTLVLVCFFAGMFITNDVALITFVPFSIMIIQKIKKEKLMIFVIVMQTIGANLGSMFTPLGNPQNLYLYSVSQIKMLDFLQLMLPITLESFVLIIVILLFSRNEKIEIIKDIKKTNINNMQMTIFTVLFAICLLTVLHVVDYRVTLVIVTISVLIFNRKLLVKADYLLLLTFVAFFIFVGNIKNIPYIEHMLARMVSGNEIVISIITSQVISNVPAAILLSGFTDKYSELILGTNIGGLGTLIASMASLISYKFYAKTEGARKGRYIAVFTIMNLLFLIIISISFI